MVVVVTLLMTTSLFEGTTARIICTKALRKATESVTPDTVCDTDTDATESTLVGSLVGYEEGCVVGWHDGRWVGRLEGRYVGNREGLLDGCRVGREVG